MAVANTLAYYDTATITAVISFIIQAPAACVIKLANIRLFWKFKNKTRGLYYKTFYDHNLQMFVIS
jgi:hypothetical protein